MGATRPASGKDAAIISRVCILFFHYPDAGRVAPISACVLCLRFVLAFCGTCTLYHTTKTLLAEYLASYTNTL